MSRQSKPSDADLLQGTLDMLILKVVALRPIHGYAIVQRIQQISKDALQIRQGSLYPALYRLENRGWLKADWLRKVASAALVKDRCLATA